MVVLFLVWAVTIWTMTYPGADDFVVPPAMGALAPEQQAEATHYWVGGVPPILWNLLVNVQGRDCYNDASSSTGIACTIPIATSPHFNPNSVYDSGLASNMPCGINECDYVFQPIDGMGEGVGDPFTVYKPHANESPFRELVDDRCDVRGCCPSWMPEHLPPVTAFMEITHQSCGVWEGGGLPNPPRCPLPERTLGPSFVDPWNQWYPDPNNVMTTCEEF